MLRARQIQKRYAAFTAVHAMDLDVEPGEVFGFLGLNGAGKTTTLRMLGGVLPPTSGTIEIDGLDLAKHPVHARQRLGFIPDRPYLYDKLTAREFLRFIGEMYGMDERPTNGTPGLTARVQMALDEQHLGEFADQLIESYSHGMKQRITLASALLHDPRLLIVDEPMVGLDPRGTRQIKATFRRLAEEGRTVFLSTHTLAVAAEVCDRIAIIHHGRIQVIGTQAEIVPAGRTLEELFLEITGTESGDAEGVA
ncbi:MAG: ABC transporter ATP-binding protein [Myxococcales bacterium]|nr:ABC transporter ATP-binding protein [Myxococcales bacterium]